ncbi:MAG: coniferyl aldehyde dehydrogenase [Betaproteobacteria bacterium]
MQALFEQQAKAFQADMLPDLETRLDRLQRLETLIVGHHDEWLQVISNDFGHRSRHETLLGDIMATLACLAHTRRHLKRWMRPRRIPTALMYRPGYNRALRQPLGVVGVVSPWNYPLYLSLTPALQALAAGNRVMLKPSELTPRFCEFLQRAVTDRFDPAEFTVVTGDASVGQAFSQLPFDHLLFTGSTPVGRHIARAAAENLTPVTLELGGKSPAILDESCDLAKCVPRLAQNKLFNAGQTCVSPDYAWVPRGREAAFETVFRAAAARMYPRLIDNPDYTSVINDRHHARLQHLLRDAQARGARIVPVNQANEAVPVGSRKIVPTLVFDVDADMAIMREEIFGPLLPVMSYDRLDDAIGYINAHDRPLALYWFGDSSKNRDRVLNGTISGGACVNDCMLQVAQEDAPFGGVGASGMGSYHGEQGFLTFSKEKSVYFRSNLSLLKAFSAPYSPRLEGALKRLRGFL